ncbi:MAG: DNA gyrase C-terminal beta-propeller domain-containing protein, partial [Planctomycetaceae bacterium]
FNHEDVRPMGRATRGVKGITLSNDEIVVGMVVADSDRTLLSICEQGFGKRTPFGIAEPAPAEQALPDDGLTLAEETVVSEIPDEASEESSAGSNMRYRRQRRGGKGLRDIKTTARNGRVVDVLSVADDDEVLMVTSRGKIQRVRAADISTIGRNTQGVRIIRLDDGDSLTSCAVIPGDVVLEAAAKAAAAEPLALPPAATEVPAVPPAAEATKETEEQN